MYPNKEEYNGKTLYPKELLYATGMSENRTGIV
jgi:hypothetical protein